MAKNNKIWWIIGLIIVGLILYNNNGMFAINSSSKLDGLLKNELKNINSQTYSIISQKEINKKSLIIEDDDFNNSGKISVIIATKNNNNVIEKNKLGEIKRLDSVNAIMAKLTPDEINKLSKDSNVLKIGLDTKVNVLLNDAIPLINNVPNKPLIEVGKGVKVCVIDTGIQDNHIYLHTLPSNNKVSINPWTGIKTEGIATDTIGHGTHVSGIIISQNTIFHGVSPGVDLYVANVFADDDSTASTILSGIDWCLSKNVDIISMSLGSDPFTKEHCDDLTWSVIVKEMLDKQRVKGQKIPLIVAAAGNEWGYGGGFPACYSEIIAVASTNKWKYPGTDISSFSSRGKFVDIAAPGENITSTYLDNSMIGMYGTSMAAPMVSSSLAYLKSIFPFATNDQLKSALYKGASPIYNYPASTQGHGLMNVYNSCNLICTPKILFNMKSTFSQSTTTTPGATDCFIIDGIIYKRKSSTGWLSGDCGKVGINILFNGNYVFNQAPFPNINLIKKSDTYIFCAQKKSGKSILYTTSTFQKSTAICKTKYNIIIEDTCPKCGNFIKI